MNTENKKLSVGIIMDGNRRWAKERNLPTMMGHKAGYEKIKDVLSWADELNISHLYIYAFSTENWKRNQEEVGYLMNIFREATNTYFKDLGKERTVRFIGNLGMLPDDLRDCSEKANQKSEILGKCALIVALSYGGRDEILRAIGKIEDKEGVSEKDFSSHLDTFLMPDPDLIIRTGGERRLSGFLTWQSVYSELFFPKMFWPDFSKKDLTEIIDEYNLRNRRFGK
jgi:undecaprenyl diphosphate synthase